MEFEFVRVKSKKVKANNGNEFTAYKGVLKNGRLIDLRFIRDLDFETDMKDFTLRGVVGNFDLNRLYPVFWVLSYDAVTEFETKVKDVLTPDSVG